MKKISKRIKKNVIKKKLIAGVVGIVVILGGASAIIFSNTNKESDTTQKLESNQELVYGKISEINGNEITYIVCTASDETTQNEAENIDTNIDEDTSEDGDMRERPNSVDGEESEFGAREIIETSPDDTSSSEDGIDSTDGEEVSRVRGTGMTSGDRPSGDRPSGDAASGELPSGELPSGDAASGELPSGDLPSGDLPSGDLPSGDMPSGDMPSGDMPSGDAPSGDLPSGDAPSGDEPSDEGAAASENTQNGSSTISSTITYVETGETVTVLIPVGTSVTTKLGTVTTFSRLAAGDVIEMVVEEQSDGSFVIISIEIVE